MSRPAYASVLATATLSRITGAMFNVAIVLLFLDRTGSAWTAAVVVAAGTIPAALTGPLLGAWLDSSARPRLLIAIDQGTSALVIVALWAAAGEVSTGVCAVLAIGYGATRPLSIGGFSRVIPELVLAEELPTANALESLSFNTAFVAGPLVSGILASLGGPSVAVLAQALLTVVVTFAVLATTSLDRHPDSPAAMPNLRSAWSSGWHVLHQNARVRAAVSLTCIWIGLTGSHVVLFPLLARELLGGDNQAGVLWAVSAAGSAGGAFMGRYIVQRAHPSHTVAVSLMLAAAGISTWALMSGPWLLLPVFLTATAAAPAMLVCAQILQIDTPAQSRGSVFTTLGSLCLAAVGIGTALAGRSTQEWSVDATIALVALGAAALAGLGWALLRKPVTP